MFNQKLFFLIFVLLFGKVDLEDNCDDWYLDFPTKFQCQEFYRHSTSSTKTTTVTTTTSTTKMVPKPASSSSSTTTTVADDFIPTLLPDIPSPEDYPTEISTTVSTTPTTTGSVSTLPEPTTAHQDDLTTNNYVIITTISTTTSFTTTSYATNSARNKIPWYLSLWALVGYGIVAVFFVFGIGVAVFHRVRRITIQARYAQMHGEVEMEPIRRGDGDESSQSSGNTDDLNVTETTLVAPPSQVSSLTVVNPRYRRASTSLLSSDESFEFRSANSSSNLPSMQNETEIPDSSVILESPDQENNPEQQRSPPRIQVPEPVSPIQPSTPPASIPTTSEETPTTERSGPKSSTPARLVERMRDFTQSRRRTRRNTNKNDPTRQQPSRKAKKTISYKE